MGMKLKNLVSFVQILVVSKTPVPPPSSGSVEEICLTVTTRLLDLADQSRCVVRSPQPLHHVEDQPGLHFHFSPDVVIGLGGQTRLEFVEETLVLAPYELALIPSGIPHREVPVARANEPFQNLVLSVYNQTITALWQRSVPGAQTLHVEHAYFDTSKDQILIGYLEELAALQHGSEAQRHFGIKGLLLAYLSTLAGIMQHAQEAPPTEKLKIAQAKRYVQEHLGSPELSVKQLAGLLHCSADYLSYLFHREVGQRLIGYINRERVKAAMNMLRQTSLSISEVAYALGFESQAYFSRVFKQVALKTPVEYRKLVEHAMVELEGRPRTIFPTAA